MYSRTQRKWIQDNGDEAAGCTVVVESSIASALTQVKSSGPQGTQAELHTRALRTFESDSVQTWRKTNAVCGGRLIGDVHNVAAHVIR